MIRRILKNGASNVTSPYLDVLEVCANFPLIIEKFCAAKVGRGSNCQPIRTQMGIILATPLDGVLKKPGGTHRLLLYSISGQSTLHEKLYNPSDFSVTSAQNHGKK